MTALIALCSITGYATEYKPWFGNFQEFEFRASYGFQQYTKTHSDDGRIRYPSFDDFTNFSLTVVPDTRLTAELEMLLSSTRRQNTGVDNIKVTTRYLQLNDIVGDPVSLAWGASLTIPTGDSKHDVSTFHRGDIDIEGHVSVGKEISSGKFWLCRYWANLGYVLSNRGAPGLRGELAWERNFFDVHQWKFFGNFTRGLGARALAFPFNGYGSVENRSVDIGARYGYCFGYNGTITAEYSRRIYARNAPEHVDSFTIGYLTTFSPF